MVKNGFTLIELLVVMAIIGILAAIVMPQFSVYRARAFDARATADLRNVATAEESYFVQYENYRSCSNAICAQLMGTTALSQGVTLSISATATGFTGTSKHTKGSATFSWDSNNGGLQ